MTSIPRFAISIFTTGSAVQPVTSRRRFAASCARETSTPRRPTPSIAGCTAVGSTRMRRRRARRPCPAARPTASLYKRSATPALSCTNVQNDCLEFRETIFFVCAVVCLASAMTDRYLQKRLVLRYVQRRPWLDLGDRFGSLYFCPAWLPSYAHRRCRGGARRLRACRFMDAPPTATGSRQHRRSACQHFLFSLHAIATSGLRRPADGRTNPRRSEDPQPLYSSHPHLYLHRRRRTRARDCRRVRTQGHTRHLDRQKRSPQ